jgi:hypothetical protein
MKTKPIVPFGIPEYEVSFAAESKFMNTPEGEHSIIYPDLNTLGQEHIDLLE